MGFRAFFCDRGADAFGLSRLFWQQRDEAGTRAARWRGMATPSPDPRFGGLAINIIDNRQIKLSTFDDDD
jgi:hypothetical protein